MDRHRDQVTERPYNRQPSPKRQHHQSRQHDAARHNDVAPRGRPRHGEQRPLPRRPTGPFDVRPPAPTPPRARRTTRRQTTTRHMSIRDRDFEDPTCNSSVGFNEAGGPAWSWRAMVVSITSMMLFASVFGLIGVMFASLAYSDHKVGDYRRSRFKTRLAWFFALFGITVTVFALVFLFIVMYALNVPRPTFKDSKYWVPPWLYDQLEIQ